MINYKLGRLPVRYDKRTLRFPKYLTVLPPVKPAVDWTPFVTTWPMMMNDSVGDCTCAAAGHLIELWTGAASDIVTPTDPQIIAAYSAITGYDPSDPSTDTGANEISVLNYWKASGIAGHQIGAYAKVDHTNHDQVMVAIDMFAGVYIGLTVTQQMMQDFGKKPWTLANSSGDPEGGHAVPVVAYDATGVTVVTWGGLQQMDWPTWDLVVEEVYAIFSQDFVNGTTSPSGFDAVTLQADLQAL